MTMNIKHLNYFKILYETKHFSKAAEQCFISQPALSIAIKQLEETLGTKLFIRQPKQLSVTSDADYLYPKICQILQAIYILPHAFNDQKLNFKLVTMNDMAQKNIISVLNIIQRYPQKIQLTLCNETTQEYDARLVLDCMKKSHEDFVCLWEEAYVLCMHSNHPLSIKDRIYLEDLHRQPFLECPPCEAHQRTIELLSCQGLNVNIIAKGDTKVQIFSMVLAGIGISFLPENMARSHPSIVIKTLENQPHLFRKIGLAFPKNSLNPMIEWIIGQAPKQASILSSQTQI